MDTRLQGARTWIVVVVVFVVAVVAAYFAGHFIEHSAAGKAVASAEQKSAAAHSEATRAQAANRILAANIWAYRASVALDQRNFGVANDAVGKVVSSLDGVDTAAARVDPAAVKSARDEALAAKVSVAADLEAQRARLLRLADDIAVLADSAGAKAAPAP